MDDICVDDLQLNPGPIDFSVLTLQDNHRSSIVWKVGGGDSQRSRIRNPSNNKFPPLHSRMVPILRDMGFDGVARLTSIGIDMSLITALVERWRSETHTFHFPTGECTITLQDVGILLGLRVDGNVVTGCTEFKGGWSKLIEDMFGKLPGNQLVGGRLQFTWLNSNFSSVSDDASEEYLVRYTQSYVLQLIGGILFTDHSGSKVHCMYIPLIRDLQRCRTLAWGAAVLAYLYRELCKSCKIGAGENAGCILLLQLWAWTRLPTLAPVPRGLSSDNRDIWGDLLGPYGLRWCGHKSFTDVTSHVVYAHRFTLDVLAPSHFIWQPYTDDVLDKLSKNCIDGNSVWCYKGPLICFYIVEPHQPDRCTRQFGMIQDIPSAPFYSNKLHTLDLKGKIETDWRQMHSDYILHWDSREQHVHVAHLGIGVADGYDSWYSNITRKFHTRIGGVRSYMLDLLNKISSVARGETDGDVNSLATNGILVLDYQFKRGICHDFPIDDRRAKEKLLHDKPKRKVQKRDHKKLKTPHTDDAIRSDQIVEFVASSHEISIHKEENEVRHHETETGDVDSSPLSHPTFDLIPPSDFDQPIQHHLNEIEIDPTPPLSHPSFDLQISADFHDFSVDATEFSERQPHNHTKINHMPPLSPPTFNLLTQSPRAHEEIVHQQNVLQEHDIEKQLSQQPPLQQHHMELRHRKHEGPTCGTGGHKVVQPYKRLRKKL